jgi:hypothetical protein
MTNFFRQSDFWLVSASLMLLCNAAVFAQAVKTSGQTKGATKVAMAKGTFDVKVAPLTADAIATEAGLAVYSIDKQWQGDIDGTSKGQMTAAQADADSGIYVALEKVTATLGGKKGSFLLVHRGYMSKGVQELSIAVVPNSGTGELAGIAGKVDINIDGGKHFYEFAYTLPIKP